MSCCNCGNYELKSVSAVVSGGILTVTIVPAQDFYDYRPYRLNLGLALPEHTGIEPLALSDGTNSFPVIDTNGQPVVSGKLRGYNRYRISYGAGGALSAGAMPAHFTIRSGLCNMEYSNNPTL